MKLIYIYINIHKFIEGEEISFQNSIKYVIEQHPDMYGEDQYNAFIDSIWMGSLTDQIFNVEQNFNVEQKNDDDHINIFNVFSSASDIGADNNDDDDDDQERLFNNNDDDDDDDYDIDLQSLNLTNISIDNGNNNKNNNNNNVRYSSRSFIHSKTV